jgi:probable rRNA maturation factor
MSTQARVAVSDHREEAPLETELLAAWELMAAAVMRALHEAGRVRRPLPEILEVSLLDDEAMARIHLEFMDVEGPTDVITFPYGDLGEILIGVETAARQAGEYGRSLREEISLYLIHGILHLAGYDDQTGDGAAEMERLQEDLLTQYGGRMDSIHTERDGTDSTH